MSGYMQLWVEMDTKPDGNLWSAYCNELGLASCGSTENEAKANLQNAISAYCRALDERGILEKRLIEKHVEFGYVQPKTPARRGLRPVLV